MKRFLSKAPFALLIVLLTFALAGTALAAIQTLTQNRSTLGGGPDGNSWPNISVAGGKFKVMNNLWNDQVLGRQTIDVEDTTGAYVVTEFTANSYNPATGQWIDTRHWPSSYPAVYQGCHWSQCSASLGAPMPIQVERLTSLATTWEIATGAAGSAGIWDAAYDIWFDTNADGYLPANPQSINQPDGTEIMIWINNRGHNANGSTGVIQPAGSKLPDRVTLAGASWDVWVARNGPGAGGKMWNVVSYVRVTPTTSFMVDTMAFVYHAKTLDCANGKCLQDGWWLTSIQAGFEIWGAGTGLGTTNFAVLPTTGATVSQGGRTTPDGRPIVHWAAPFDIVSPACSPVGGSATYELRRGTTVISSGAMTRGANGMFTATVPPVYPAHDDAQVIITKNCGGTITTETVNLYIDPSGLVLDQQGNPVNGATVALYYSPSGDEAGPFDVVPNGSEIMSPENRENPDLTDDGGFYRWDVMAGWYKVRAEKAGCHAPGNPAQPYVESPAVQVTELNPVTNLDLVLDCGGGGPSGLPVVVTPMSDWNSGYCRNVTVTNNTAEAVDWKATFTLEDGGTIYNFWNVVWTQNGNQVTIEGLDWNGTLQPGQSTHSIGFCANR